MNIRPAIAFLILLISRGAWAQTPLLGLGDSLGEGVQSADASQQTQPFSYLAVMARQMKVPLPLPLIGTSPIGVVGYTFGRSRINPFVPAANLAVSGSNVATILSDRSDLNGSTETDLVLSPRIGTQFDVAEQMEPGIVACFIGSNDVLRAAVHYNQLDASQMTSVADFTFYYHQIAGRLQAMNKPVVVATIPNVTRVGFLMDNATLTRFTGTDYGLPGGSFTTLIAGVLLRLHLAGPALLQDPNWVLDPVEVEQIRQRATAFNQVIMAEANARNFAVADLYTVFEQLAAHPPVLQGVKLTTAYLGGGFSLDGFHPSNIVYALIANEFLRALNQRYGSNFPLVGTPGLNQIAATDPFLDRNGNGVVTGRPFAGLFETLAPLLGISGDDETLRTHGANAPNGQKFLSEYRRMTGRPATTDATAETIGALRDTLGIDTLTGPNH